jgi:hypothetical protein
MGAFSTKARKGSLLGIPCQSFDGIPGYQGTIPLAHNPWVIWNRIRIQVGSFQRLEAASA